MSHAIFLKNEKTTKWAFFGIKNVKNEKIHFLFNPRRNTILFDMSHSIFLKIEKTTKLAFFALKKSKTTKRFGKNAKKNIFPSHETVPKRQRYRNSVKNCGL